VSSLEVFVAWPTVFCDVVDINCVTGSRRIANNDSVHKDVLTRATLGESHGAQSHRSKGLT
jgi:hypothetical protein